MIDIIRNAIKQHLNIPKTIFFNLIVFHLKDAIKFPVYLYGKVDLEGIHRGCLALDCIKRGTIKYGGGWTTELFGNSQRYRSLLRLKGKLYCGNNVIINQGSIISINKNATVIIGNNVRISERFTLHSKLGIDIGDNCYIGWNTQIIDSDFHYMLNNGNLSYRNAKIVIGNNVWLANGVSIMKGAHLPSFSVVASHSIVNKDLRLYGERCLFGGIPAHFIKEGVERLSVRDSKVDTLFNDFNDVLIWSDVRDILNLEQS